MRARRPGHRRESAGEGELAADGGNAAVEAAQADFGPQDEVVEVTRWEELPEAERTRQLVGLAGAIRRLRLRAWSEGA